uniref:Uncharacterized protein n=1 Tax=Arundo donax TaxID=35708 RepID=A0A0A8ZNC9_ARUDO
MNEVPDVVNKVCHPLKASYAPSSETPAILREISSPVKGSPSGVRDFLIPSKEAPYTLTESAPSLKETSATSVESHYSSTETSAILNESPPLKDSPAPRELAILSGQGPANAENRHLSHVTDVQNLQLKLNNIEAKLEVAETLIVKLREEIRTTIQERDKLLKEMVFLKSAGTARTQAGFPLLFVLYMAFVGVSLGYLLQL